ncbi:hypothetical protein [Photorhabdus asymbiotica]|uniref:hypothetical protein n=1 Tax=Photorhabdus asymbiotica TaxID=291112 RepID=UPI003DA77C67
MPNYRELSAQENPEMQARVEKRIEQAKEYKKRRGIYSATASVLRFIKRETH